MNKVYQRIVWENFPSENTAVNESNLNRMDYAIDQIDDRVVAFNTTKANQTDLLQSLKNITYNDSTGIFTFTWWNGSTREVDLNIEKIPVSFAMSPQGILTMTTADGTVFTADIASLIKLYTFNNSTDIRFNTVTDADGNKTITAFIVDGSVTESKLQPNFLADCRQAVSDAEDAQEAAETAQGLSETARNQAQAAQTAAENAQTGAETAETNAEAAQRAAETAKTLAETAATNADSSKTAAQSAQTAAEAAQSAAEIAETNASNNATSASNSATQASTSASAAATSETNAINSALKAEGHAVGQQNGTDVGNTSPFYHNSAKYWAEQAQAAAGGGVTTFNGRNGAVVSEIGDYNLDMMGDWAYVSDVTISSVTYHTFWKVQPTSSNQVYGVAIHPTNGRLYRIYNNKGTYSATNYDKDTTYQFQTAYNASTNKAATMSDVLNQDSKDNTATFTSSDVATASATSWSDVNTLTSGEKHSSIFAKVSQMFKNIRYLYNNKIDLGKILTTVEQCVASTDAGNIPNAAVISELNSNLAIQDITNDCTWNTTDYTDLTKKVLLIGKSFLYFYYYAHGNPKSGYTLVGRLPSNMRFNGYISDSCYSDIGSARIDFGSITYGNNSIVVNYIYNHWTFGTYILPVIIS